MIDQVIMTKARVLFFVTISIIIHNSYAQPPINFFKQEPRRPRDTTDQQPQTHQSVSPGYAHCDEDKLMNYLADCQIINPESIIELAADDLNPVCRKVSNSLEQIQDYLKTCTPPNQSDLYMSLINGVKTLYIKLCTGTEFLSRYQTYAKCFHELSNDLESCDGPADWNESDDEKVCKAYKEICDCYYIKTAKVCGDEAAATIKELMVDVFNSIVSVKCEFINANPSVEDPMSLEYVKRINKLADFSEGKRYGLNCKLKILLVIIYTIIVHLN